MQGICVVQVFQQKQNLVGFHRPHNFCGMGFHRPQNFCGISFHRLQNFCGMHRVECPVASGNLKPKFAEIANGTTWYRDISCLPLKPPQSFKPRIVIKTGFFVFLWIWPEPVRGSQREENFQKTSLKARKKILCVLAAIFFIFQTCFQYSLTVLLFLPYVCFIQKCHGWKRQNTNPYSDRKFFVDLNGPGILRDEFLQAAKFLWHEFSQAAQFLRHEFLQAGEFLWRGFSQAAEFLRHGFSQAAEFLLPGFRRPQNFCVNTEIALLFFIHAIWNVCAKNLILISCLHGLINYKYLFFTFSLQLEIMRKVRHAAVEPCRVSLVSPIHLHQVYKSWSPLCESLKV